MKATILDSSDDRGATCYLCKITLEDYINGLPTEYREYEIQREIVTNVYLDRLVETVLSLGHIPSIVLVVEPSDFVRLGQQATVKKFKILDGLQRTFRLQAIRKTVDLCLKLDKSVDYLGMNKFKFSRQFSEDLRRIDSSTDVLRAILIVRHKQGDEALLNAFKTNTQCFEVWTGLSPEAEVRKMLTLNAGHKPVKIRHQLELLFLNMLPMLKSGDSADFDLVREKEVSATQFSKSRPVGKFHFQRFLLIARNKPLKRFRDSTFGSPHRAKATVLMRSLRATPHSHGVERRNRASESRDFPVSLRRQIVSSTEQGIGCGVVAMNTASLTGQSGHRLSEPQPPASWTVNTSTPRCRNPSATMNMFVQIKANLLHEAASLLVW